MEEVKELAKSLGNPGLEKLWKAIRKERIVGVSKEEVKSYLSKLGEKQIFKPLPPSLGKTASEDHGVRGQMDIIDMKYSKSLGYSAILVMVNIFSRMAYARPVKNKTPEKVAEVLRIILDEMDPQIQVCFSDSGNEFVGPVRDLLDQRGIIHRKKK